eukprot:2045886-Amphidinium_carterae.1
MTVQHIAPYANSELSTEFAVCVVWYSMIFGAGAVSAPCTARVEQASGAGSKSKVGHSHRALPLQNPSTIHRNLDGNHRMRSGSLKSLSPYTKH